MNALTPLFLWLLPLALLPVIIHLLNRLRYQTVHWAAMMFLRSADRDASRRARIRQWIILALRCLMLLLFLLALARLQSRGRLARFLDPGSNLIVIVFDRSASMEQQRGGVSGRERALTLLQQGLGELRGGTRVLWMDSVDGEVLPIPPGIEVSRLPVASATSTSSDMGYLIRRALAEVARADAGQAEIWIPTDRQSSAWFSEGTAAPDWSEWAALEDRVTLRILDVGEVAPDPGNRSLQLSAPPLQAGDRLRVELSLIRETGDPESIPLRVETGGLSLQEDVLVEGRVFQWEQELPLGRDGDVTHARISIPADSHPLDNEVAVAWRDRGEVTAGGDLSRPASERLFRAAVLPRPGRRRWQPGREPGEEHVLWITDREVQSLPSLQEWVQQGGLLLQVPGEGDLPSPRDTDDPLTVPSWVESSGVLATRGRDPLRLDLVEVSAAVDLPEGEGIQVLARLSDGRPFLTRQSRGGGAVLRLATLPDSEFSNLDDGFVLVPVLQRLLLESAGLRGTTGTRVAGEVSLEDPESWKSLEDGDRRAGVDAGRFRNGDRLLALNRPGAEDVREQIPVEELRAWAEPLDLRVFEDRSDPADGEAQRTEFTGLLVQLGLGMLVAESWLLTRNIRRSGPAASAWKGAAA